MNHGTVFKAAALSLVFFLAGCASQSPASRFYVLSPVSEEGGLQLPELVLGVGPVRLPDYLSRIPMVWRSGPVTLEVDEFSRWGGDLTQNIQDVLAEDLSRLLGSRQIITHPWSSSLGVPLQLVVDIRRFEMGPGRQVVLDLQWRLHAREGETFPLVRKEHILVAAAGESRSDQVAAMNSALAELATRISVVLAGEADH